jgi:hypothetical protein
MCSQDLLFWVNSFAWISEPRGRIVKALPFITWPFQDKFISELYDGLGRRDMFIEKSRDMGASWTILTLFLWKWCYSPEESFLVVSRNEKYVDVSGNPKCLFYKFDYILKSLPGWLVPRIKRTEMRLENLDNGSVINGESTTGDIARGDRRTAIMLDELSAFKTDDGYAAWAATGSATGCRIVNGTPRGTGNIQYELSKKPGIKKIRLHWSVHPEKRKGLYDTFKGMVRVLDEGFKYPPGYKFILDGKIRSPWYDYQCARAAVPQEIESELDIGYMGSNYQYFPQESLEEHIRAYCIPPMVEGELEYDLEDGTPFDFAACAGGSTRLWFRLSGRGKPPEDRKYVIGCDISEGTGASNSCLSVYDAKTGEKVCESWTCREDPISFARRVVAFCKWFNNAFLIWEANGGPGQNFGKMILELTYTNIYYRQKSEKSSSLKMSDVPGWFSTEDGKIVLLGFYRSAIKEGKVLNRSEASVRECSQYVWQVGTGRVEHVAAAQSKQNPTGARESHGDAVIADALALRAMMEFGTKKARRSGEIDDGKAEQGSYAWRQSRRRSMELARSDDW